LILRNIRRKGKLRIEIEKKKKIDKIMMSWCYNELNLIKNPKISNKSPNTYTLVRYMDKQIERSLERSTDRQ